MTKEATTTSILLAVVVSIDQGAIEVHKGMVIEEGYLTYYPYWSFMLVMPVLRSL